MGVEDSIAPSTPIDLLSSSSAAALSRFDTAALRRDFEQLSVDDIKVLASFPVEPHDLIRRVVAVTHCLLLSLSSEHTELELCAPPWPLLRLQLLDGTPRIWRKIRKRAWQLETGAKALSPVQIRFGCKELVPYVEVSLRANNRQHGAWHLNRLAQVSTIAASLGAWCVFCLCCSALPSMRIYRRCEPPTSRASEDASKRITSISCVKLSPSHRSPPKQDKNVTTSSTSTIAKWSTELSPITHHRHLVSSKRVGIKVGGRFLLFHTRFSSSSSSGHSIDMLGEWSAYGLQANRSGRQQKSADLQVPADTSWWTPFHAIKTQISSETRPFKLYHMTPLARYSLLLQLGFHEHILERPQRIILHVTTSQALSPTFILKLGVVAIGPQQQLSLFGVGNASIMTKTTLAELRRQLEPLIAKLLSGSADGCSSFRFIYRASLLATSQERHVNAIMLLPFALLVAADTFQVKELTKHHRASQLWIYQSDVAQALVNVGLPDNIPLAENIQSIESCNAAPQVFAVHQSLVSIKAVPSIDALNSLAIAEIFTHWRAFVYFQQLQNSSVLFQLHKSSPKRQIKSMQKLPKHCRRETPEDESIPYGPNPQPLPRKWLLPLYATIDVASPTTGVFKTPFGEDVMRILALPCRLVLADAQFVVHLAHASHVTTEHNIYGIHIDLINITFLRDESCPLDLLVSLKGAYVWLIVPRKPHNNREVHAAPTEWMRDLYRFVQHPTYDFQSPNCQAVLHFRVRMSWDVAERAVEAAFWSKDVDWALSMSSTDLYDTVLRQMFDALCRSHPPAFGVDSVKFSKLLYEANIQPTHLSIGDAAFLFASNLTHGFTYELNFNGFVCAVEWLAQYLYGESSKKNMTSPVKSQYGIQHGMLQWQTSRRSEQNGCDRLIVPLRRFCYETLVHLPSLSYTWNQIMDSWRRARKQQCIQNYVLKYCAATRLRASWKGLITWRIFLQKRQRMREQRLAATKLQSFARERKQYCEYRRIRSIITRTQFRIHARSELRRLRAERAAFIERMRIRMVKWMRHHLWLLHEWKKLNAEKAARRDRIREKRLRCLGIAIFPIDTWRVRFSLYRAKPNRLVSAAGLSDSVMQCSDAKAEEMKPQIQQDAPNELYEVEILDPAQSSGLTLYVSQQLIDQYIVDEIERLALQREQGLVALNTPVTKQTSKVMPTSLTQNKLARGRKQQKAVVVGDSVVYPVLKPNIILLALARRLAIIKHQDGTSLRWYSNPMDTSLGKFLVYTPTTSTRCRYDLAASLVISVLQFSQFQSMRLNASVAEDTVIAADEVDTTISASESLTHKSLCAVPHQVHRIVNGPHKILALQYILSYVLQYGVQTPTYSMMPDVIEERQRQLKEREKAALNAVLNRERQLITMVQARMRQRLASKARLQLALSSYLKQYDRERGQFVYVFQRQSGDSFVLGEKKPLSLYDQDVPLPADKWELVSSSVTSHSGIQYFNPRRGIYSRYNDITAATVIQHWFRDKMWNGINNWKLRDIALALNYHSICQKPATTTDPSQLENLKGYALQLQLLHHQYQAAYPLYEAALKVRT
ncbi:unnamed protein product [Phytophthora lilii]|uniref:Unnamed protein product n=1 Tax=Phytophthora lilii TaxID=2077276 RepID=A0A9W6TKA2_9STRA|nr:unnamed protein product [Phytophthora lilii]